VFPSAKAGGIVARLERMGGRVGGALFFYLIDLLLAQDEMMI